MTALQKSDGQRTNPAAALWADAMSYKNHRAPVVIEIPLGSYLRAALVAIPLIIALLVILPNPGVLPV